MARDHGRIKTSIWSDPDFVSLRSVDQHAYLMLVTNLGLSRCGVINYIPARFDRLAADLTVNRIRKSVEALEAARFAVVDERTQELLIRSYVRHDGVLDRLNMGKATGTAFEAVVSRSIREAIGEELCRYMKEEPDLPGWNGLAATSPEAFAMASGMESGKS